MKWRGRRGSQNIEDRRGRSVAQTGGMGLIGMLVILGLGMLFGVDVTPFLQGQSGGQIQTSGAVELTEEDQVAGQYVSVTLADTEEIWADIFARQVGQPYDPVTLVLFKGVTNSPCGNASGRTGPFYCPGDRKVYLDTGFFTTMQREMGARGDFAAAYVVAHEVAHHVQNELGILGRANQIRAQSSQTESNQISVRIELQADCYSGVWARQAQAKFGSVEQGDIAEALDAAMRIGDDTLQRNAGQRPKPHTYTHGTSDQRQRWFARGYETGDVRQCDTFSTQQL